MKQPPKIMAKAFDEWIAAQQTAIGLVNDAEQPGTAADWAEGYRWVTRMASIALEWVVEKNDPLHPVVFLNEDDYHKFIVDNPDLNRYFATIDENETYRLFGKRGEAIYIGINLGSDIFNWGSGAAGGNLGQYDLDNFEISENGEFEITLSPDEHEGNWIRLEKGTQHVTLRETFSDLRKQEAAKLSIELTGRKVPPPELTPEEFADKLATAAKFFLFVVQTSISMWSGFGSRVNNIGGGSGQHHVKAGENEINTHCDSQMYYMGSRWSLEDGHALVVTIRPPEGNFRYWGITLVNPWMESYDSRYARPCTNNHKADRNEDGTWRLVIAADDPGVANWVDTGGRLEGFAMLRWVTHGEVPPDPDCELMSLSSLRL
ncbi:MAG TPA: DUF1214 domain-containing protein [Deltaproteobacteria bacterium]|nr:DUF1214 domain-containing protein [Candidatus Binatota bacterium]HIL14081.1 DUF1214 domain-containing protein [Deltaproteobacteria bacterium]